MPARQRRPVSIVNGRVREVHSIDTHTYEMEYSFAEWKRLLIECHTPPMCAGRRDYTCKFGCDRMNIH
jgi:hypothetical protein